MMKQNKLFPKKMKSSFDAQFFRILRKKRIEL